MAENKRPRRPAAERELRASAEELARLGVNLLGVPIEAERDPDPEHVERAAERHRKARERVYGD